MSDLLLGTLSHCHFHHYIHYWCDFHSMFDLSWSPLFIRIFIVLLSSLSLLVIHPIHSTSLILFLHWLIPGLIFSLHHSCISHYQFDLLYHFIINTIFTLGSLRSMVHEIFYRCCILYMRAWVFHHRVFGPSFPSFLLPYHPSIRYVPCLKTTLRP